MTLCLSVLFAATDSNHMKMLSNAKNENKCSAASEHARNVSVKLSFRRNMKINVLARFSARISVSS